MIENNGREVIKLVNIKLPPYNTYFKENPHSMKNITSQPLAHFIDSRLANTLMQACKNNNTVIFYNSAYRAPSLYEEAYRNNPSKYANPWKSAHGAGSALDIQAVVPKDVVDRYKNNYSDIFMLTDKGKNQAIQSKVHFITHIQSNTKSKNNPNGIYEDVNLRWEADFLSMAKGQNDYSRISYQDPSGKFVSRKVYNKGFHHVDTRLTNEKDFNGVVQAQNELHNKIAGNQSAVEDIQKMKSITVYESGGRYVSYPTMVSTEEQIREDKNASKFAKIFKERIGLEGNAKQVTIQNIYDNEKFTVVSDKYKFAGYINPKRPISLVNGGPPVIQAIKIDSRQLNNLKNVDISEIQVTNTLDKLRRNVIAGHVPFGHELKNDAAPVAIKLILDKLFENQRSQAIIDRWAAIKASGADYIDCFLLERVSRVLEERHQIVQSISEEYKVYFSGKAPEVVRFSGKILNTYNQQWAYDFEYLYDNFLRGSKAVENRIRAFMTIRDRIYEILILKLGLDENSHFEAINNFEMDAIVLQKVEIGEYRNPLVRTGVFPKDFNTSIMSSTQTQFSKNAQDVINSGLENTKSGNVSGTSAKDPNVPIIEPDQIDPKTIAFDTGYAILNTQMAGIPDIITPTIQAARTALNNSTPAKLSKFILNSTYPSDIRLKDKSSQEAPPRVNINIADASRDKYSQGPVVASKVSLYETKTMPPLILPNQPDNSLATDTLKLGRPAEEMYISQLSTPIDKIDYTQPALTDKQKNLNKQYEKSINVILNTFIKSAHKNIVPRV